jgi:serine/threonine protein kinase
VDRPEIQITKIVTEHTHSIILEGQYNLATDPYLKDDPDYVNDNDETKPKFLPVIIKFFEHGHHNVSDEIHIYEKIRKAGGDTPWFSKNYEVWGEPVLIMQKLDKITTDDNEYKIGIDVINQLRYIHKFGVHSDIKPSNVMKCNFKNKYFLIDNGGVTTDKLAYGYRRHTWTERWTSQKMHPTDENENTLNQITTSKHDLVENVFMMRGIQIVRENFPGKTVRVHLQDGDNPQKGIRGILRLYCEKLAPIDRKKPVSDGDYDALIAILRGHQKSDRNSDQNQEPDYESVIGLDEKN